MIGLGFASVGAAPVRQGERISFLRNKSLSSFIAYEILVYLPFAFYLFVFHRDWLWMYGADTRDISWFALLALTFELCCIAVIGFIVANRIKQRNRYSSLKALAAFWLIGMHVFMIMSYRKLIFYGDYNSFQIIKKAGVFDEFHSLTLVNSPLFIPLIYFSAALLIAYVVAIKILRNRPAIK